MDIITISREFGSGGKELGKRIADNLGYDYYDKEIITEIANKHNLDENFLDTRLDNHNWNAVASKFGFGASQSGKVKLLLEQKNVLEEIAKKGKSCVIVGRDADVILKEYEPFKVFVCSDVKSRIERCRLREGMQDLTDKEIKKNMETIDKNRARTREILSGSSFGNKDNYDITVNSSSWDMEKLAKAVINYFNDWKGRK